MDKIELPLVSQAVGWLNGEDSQLDESQVRECLNTMVLRFRERYRATHDGRNPIRLLDIVPHPLSLEGLLGHDAAQLIQKTQEATELWQEQERIKQEKARTVVSQPVRLNSILLLDSIAHVCQMYGYAPTQSRSQMILYCLYGSLLAKGKDRLDI